MWQRKTPAEIRRVDRRARFSPIYPLGFAFFAATLMTLARSWGYGGYLLPPLPPMPLSRSLLAFPFYFALMFAFLYLMQIVRRIPEIPDHSAMLCDRCQRVVGYTTDPHCSCGGRLELLTHWRWVGEDATKQSSGHGVSI